MTRGLRRPCITAYHGYNPQRLFIRRVNNHVFTHQRE
jgi:hypothetical protein